MSFDGKIGSLTVREQTIITQDHPPITLGGLIGPWPGGGLINVSPWPGGTILTRDSDSKLIPWDGDTGTPVGVLSGEVDPTRASSAVYLAHGTVAITALVLADGSPPNMEQLYILAAAGIYGV